MEVALPVGPGGSTTVTGMCNLCGGDGLFMYTNNLARLTLGQRALELADQAREGF